MSAELTLGAEEELHLIDDATKRLSARAPRLLRRLPPDLYGAELQRSTVETNVPVVTSLSDLRREILSLRRGLIDAAATEGLVIAAAGTAPQSGFADFELTSSARFGRMKDQYRLLVDEQLICGLQVHVGVSDRDLAVQISARVAPVLPALLALSASSPFLNGQDTGYASSRSLIWLRWPSAGATGPVGDAAEYDTLLGDLIRSGVIADTKMAYFDVRPSAHAPTLELRICDACPIVDDAVLIAGLFRAAVRQAELDLEAGRPVEPRAAPLHRAAMWRAARSGLSGELLDLEAHPTPLPAATAIRRLVDGLRPQLEELGDWEEVRELSEATLARGNSADRQRAAFAERGELDDVVDLVVRETRGPAAGEAPRRSRLSGYRYSSGDEAVGPGLYPRSAYAEVASFFHDLTPAEAARRCEQRDEWAARHGAELPVAGDRLDLIPRVVTAHEWRQLAEGLTQRARALEAFVRDAYGERRLVADGLISEERLLESSGWRVEATLLPPGSVRAPLMAFDVFRTEFGSWRVLGDSVYDPRGLVESLLLRELVDEIVPDAPRPAGLLNPRSLPALIRETVLHAAPEGVAALLTPGPSSPHWGGHRLLAERAGLLLLEADELELRDGRVVERASGRSIGALVVRLDAELLDLRSGRDDRLGARIVEAASRGRVVLAGAPGNGLADDQLIYRLVPELIEYYLGEKPVLETVPTYRLADDGERLAVLDRLGEFVTKPVSGADADRLVVGPSATADELLRRATEIEQDPEGWVAQEPVALSSAPLLTPTGLLPRRLGLRAFVFVTGTGVGEATLGDGAVTRFAPEGSTVVTLARGGGLKDTWIVGSDDEKAAARPQDVE